MENTAAQEDTPKWTRDLNMVERGRGGGGASWVWVDDSAIALTLPLSAGRLFIINVGLMGRWIRADLDQGGKEAQTLIRPVWD